MNIQNIRLLVEYDGTPFSGWQRQLGNATVQQCLEDIIRSVTGERNVLYSAGRTDSGVHARGQVCNFFTKSSVAAERWASILNHTLSPSIRVIQSDAVTDRFHAQKDALSKVYEYRILNRRVASALDAHVLFYPRPLDWDRIRLALPAFLGSHDFKSFQGARASVKTTVRSILRLELDESRAVDGLYRIEVEGDGFLKQMVRAIVGTLIQIGQHKRTIEDIDKIIDARDRRRAGPTVSPSGLCLLRVNYPHEAVVS